MALGVGTPAPDFTLEDLTGLKFPLREALGRGPVVLAFFKVSCPTCQYTLPFLDRLHKLHHNDAISLVGISQDDRLQTAAFLKHFGVNFPVLLDDKKTYPVSNAYRLSNVPTLFWITQDGQIDVSSVGWMRQDIEELNRRMAAIDGKTNIPLFGPQEQIAEFRAG